MNDSQKDQLGNPQTEHLIATQGKFLPRKGGKDVEEFSAGTDLQEDQHGGRQ